MSRGKRRLGVPAACGRGRGVHISCDNRRSSPLSANNERVFPRQSPFFRLPCEAPDCMAHHATAHWGGGGGGGGAPIAGEGITPVRRCWFVDTLDCAARRGRGGEREIKEGRARMKEGRGTEREQSWRPKGPHRGREAGASCRATTHTNNTQETTTKADKAREPHESKTKSTSRAPEKSRYSRAHMRSAQRARRRRSGEEEEEGPMHDRCEVRR